MALNLVSMKVGQRLTLLNTRPTADDDEEMRIERRIGSFYGENGKFDFEVKTAAEAEEKLTRWGYTETQY